MAGSGRRFRLSLKIGRTLMAMPADKKGVPYKDLDDYEKITRLLNKAYELASGTTYDKQVFVQEWDENQKYL